MSRQPIVLTVLGFVLDTGKPGVSSTAAPGTRLLIAGPVEVLGAGPGAEPAPHGAKSVVFIIGSPRIYYVAETFDEIANAMDARHAGG